MNSRRTQKRVARKAKPRASRLVPKEARPRPAVADVDDLPLYCDLSCPKADFPPVDAVGACRREQAVWCGLLKRYNTKNGKCLVGKG